MNIDECKMFWNSTAALSLPYKTSWGFVFKEIQGRCPECNQILEDLRGNIIEYNNCVEVKTVGLCYKCKLLIECDKIRRYRDGRSEAFNQKEGWKKCYQKKDLIYTFINFFKKIFKGK